MEDRTLLTVNGQEFQQADVNNLGKVSSLADDRVLAELLRLAPFDGTNVARAVTPYGYTRNASVLAGLVRPSGNTGAVCVNAFRAVVGSRGTVLTLGSKDNWHDIRSAIFTNATGTPNDPTVALALNASGNPRWDLIYATITVDANGPSVTRYVKNPATLVTAPQSLPATLVTTVTVGAVTGTPGAAPAHPATPADTSTSFVIPLAYVRVPNGFTSTSAVIGTDIHTIAPMAIPSASSGGVSVRVATCNTQVAQLPATNVATWGSAGTQPPSYVPSDMVGGHQLLVFIDLGGASPAGGFSTAAVSHVNGSGVDNSIDWSRRYFSWMATMGAFGTFEHQSLGADLHSSFGYAEVQLAPALNSKQHAQGMGASFADTLGANLSKIVNIEVGPDGSGYTFPTNRYSASVPSAGTLGLYVDRASGNIGFFTDGNVTGVKFIIWLTASAQFSNVA